MDDPAHPADVAGRGLFETAPAAPPAVTASYARFKARVDALGSPQDPPREEPSPERALDLYLACACEEGDAAALRHFESSLMPAIRAAIAQVTSQEDLIDEACQELR